MLIALESYYWRYCSASELVNMILAFIETRRALLTTSYNTKYPKKKLLDLKERKFIGICFQNIQFQVPCHLPQSPLP